MSAHGSSNADRYECAPRLRSAQYKYNYKICPAHAHQCHSRPCRMRSIPSSWHAPPRPPCARRRPRTRPWTTCVMCPRCGVLISQASCQIVSTSAGPGVHAFNTTATQCAAHRCQLLPCPLDSHCAARDSVAAPASQHPLRLPALNYERTLHTTCARRDHRRRHALQELARTPEVWRALIRAAGGRTPAGCHARCGCSGLPLQAALVSGEDLRHD